MCAYIGKHWHLYVDYIFFSWLEVAKLALRRYRSQIEHTDLSVHKSTTHTTYNISYNIVE